MKYLVISGFHHTRLSPMRSRCDKIDFIRVCSPAKVAEIIKKACQVDGQCMCQVAAIDLDDRESVEELAYIIHYGITQQINVGVGKDEGNLT